MKLLSIVAASLLVSACGQENPKTAADERVIESRAVVKEFFGQLKGELQAGMKAGGPVQAIEVCQVKAPLIAAEISKKKGWDVARTSLKTRNPANKADAWEHLVLQRFEEQKAQGKDIKQLEHYAFVEEKNVKKFRYMKAIPTGGVCMNCHGTTLDPAVAQKIKQRYPEDQAVGYKPGDIRGAFTITQTVQ